MSIAIVTPHRVLEKPLQGWVVEDLLFVLQSSDPIMWEQLRLSPCKRNRDWPAYQVFGPSCPEQKSLWTELGNVVEQGAHVIVYLSWTSGSCSEVIEFLSKCKLDKDKTLFLIPESGVSRQLIQSLKQAGFESPNIKYCVCDGVTELQELAKEYVEGQGKKLPE